jgi:hypothetical protein
MEYWINGVMERWKRIVTGCKLKRNGDRVIFHCGGGSLVINFVGLWRNRECSRIDKWSFNRFQLKQSKEGWR